MVRVKTGNLRDNIKLGKKEPKRRTIIADTDYALIVEVGTRDRPAQPYLRPAMDSQKRLILVNLRNKI